MHKFIMARPCLPGTFSFFHTSARKRLMRPSSRPASSFLFLTIFCGPGLRLGARYLAISLSVFGQSCR